MKKKKEYMKLAVKGICFALIFAGIFLFLQIVFQAKWFLDGVDNTGRTTSWDEYRSLEPDTVDALFVGTSHVYCAIDPMYIYKNYGITTYPVSGPGMRFDLSYLTLKDALKTQKPKAVFLDMSAIHFRKRQSEAKVHKVLDQLPLSPDKLEFAWKYEGMKALDALFPLFRYHSRWDKLEDRDFRYAFGSLEGTAIRGHYASYKQVQTRYTFEDEVDPEREIHVTPWDMEYLGRIVKLCKDRNIDLVFCKLPAPIWYRCQSEESARLAEEFGVKFEEFYYHVEEMNLRAEDGVYRDEKDHMNQIGSERMSAYWAEYLLEHYDLEDQRGKNTRWDEDILWYDNFMESIQPVA